MNQTIFPALLALLFAYFWPASGVHAQWTQAGEASFYADKFHGRRTASGELYDKNAYTAAHRELPIGSVVRVSRPGTRHSVEVRINDCGPHRPHRIIDISRAAAQELDLLHDGVGKVVVELVTLGDGHCACDRKRFWSEAERAAALGPTLPVANMPADTTHAKAPAPTMPPITTPEPAPSREDTAAPNKPTPTPVAGWAVQAGAFGSRDNAQRLLQRLREQGIEPAFAQEFAQPERSIHRVYAGPFASREEAADMQKRLKQTLNIEGIVLEWKP